MTIVNSLKGVPSEEKRDTAVSLLKEALLQEIRDIIGEDKIKSRNVSISDEEIFENYIEYLRKISDPRTEYISAIMGEQIDLELLDNELVYFEGLSQRFKSLFHGKVNEGNVGDALQGLDFGTTDDLVSAVRSYDEKEALVFLSRFQRPVLERVLLTAVGVNVTLMITHNLDSTDEFAQFLYDSLSIGNVSGKSVVSLGVIIPFLYEAVVKIKAQGIVNYLKNNKLDAFLNIAGLGEMGLMVDEHINNSTTHAAIGSLLRSLRILRILRITQRSKAVKEYTQSLVESAPSLMKVAATFWGFSALSTLYFMEVYGEFLPEFSNLTSSLDEMSGLFFSDDGISLIQDMRGVEEVSKITTEISVWLARSYQFISNIFMIGIPPAVVYDALTQSNTTKRYLAGIWEKLQSIEELLMDLRKEVKTSKSNTIGAITRLRNSINPKNGS